MQMQERDSIASRYRDSRRRQEKIEIEFVDHHNNEEISQKADQRSSKPDEMGTINLIEKLDPQSKKQLNKLV